MDYGNPPSRGWIRRGRVGMAAYLDDKYQGSCKNNKKYTFRKYILGKLVPFLHVAHRAQIKSIHNVHVALDFPHESARGQKGPNANAGAGT